MLTLWMMFSVVATPVDSWPLLGQMATRPASAIAASTWSIGCETLDRDFADYAKFKSYVGPLGAKGMRLQAGWAKCEKVRGNYDWAWLDAVVDDARAQGVQPWLEASYGNPLYPGGGGTGLGGGLPTSPEALDAWAAWCRALARHFAGRVDEFEIWNEPDLSKSNSPSAFVELYLRAAEAIRAEQPKARLYAMGLAGNVSFAKDVLNQLKERGKLGLVDAVTMHTYPSNPDDLGGILALRRFVVELDPRLTVRQGETGAPSTSATFGALSGRPWTELTQAKYDLRRMLAHHAEGLAFNLFTLMELHYPGRWNTKGKLKANEDGTVAYAKPAYRAAQRVFGLFDDGLVRVADARPQASTPDLAATLYRGQPDGAPLATLWLKYAAPADAMETRAVDLSWPAAGWKEPVWVDLLSGRVSQLPRECWSIDGTTMRFVGLPVGDWPVLVADRAAVPIAPQ